MLTVLQIKAIDTVDGLTPDLKLSESPHCPDEGDKDTSKSKVDAGFFRLTCVPTDGRPHWADQIVPVEFKSHKTENDPYDDRSEDSPDADAIKRKEVRGQLIDYAEEVFRYQHRTEVYMLLIMGQRFRFLRWDRSGTVVTPATNYYQNPDVLCEMLWRMSLLDDTQLGLDPTAIRIRPDMPDFDKMNEAAIPHPSDIDHAERTFPADFVISDDFVFRYVRKGFAESLGAEWPRYRLEVPDGDSVRSFLVGKPTFRASGMAGRGTRGYIALDCKTQQFVWLKDAWRAYYDLVDKEGDVLIHLNETGVPHVPTVVCHGDILDQATKSPEYWDDKNGSTDQCPLRRHKHYRLVVKEVCMPLVKFQSGLQLLEIIYTCVRGMSYVLLIIVHRDVSGGNILILPSLMPDPNTKTMAIKWLGLLVDWELSKPVHDKQGTQPRARQPERTGTWQYMSVATLNEHTKVVETSDELESFFHVVLYYSVRYLVSNCADVSCFIKNFFDSYNLNNHEYLCGKTKRVTMTTGQLLLDDSTDEDLAFSSPLDGFFSKLLKLFKAHYIVTKYDKSKPKKPLPKPRLFIPMPQPKASIAQWLNDDSDDDAETSEEDEGIAGGDDPSIAPAQRALAAKVQRHQCMLKALKAATTAVWPKGDRVIGDNVELQKLKPVPAVASSQDQPTVTGPNKRRRTGKTPVSAPILSINSAPLP
ncbi:uncharacterized protein TRAVEDRAFT_134722 [Trametes versicolor FP-101664 SS1]|uniref:uncharacterized protein n=1 Tax=Trametes versicolor (strain FP-101664) TaxID=717944 RepID=UPI00046215A7|nr:uncharacterized protein TRAVEDRAFT_134722 [Trametes versicolor FP-101664 SS1]EIW53020.1 hypothetical protein TRAVEDRAFT_134722 [Trametes versicolor FP-101664 SS1]